MFLTFQDNLRGTILHDYIFLRNLHLSVVVGKDAWGRERKAQPVVVSLRLQKSVSTAGQSDKIGDTVSYGKICKDIMSSVENVDNEGGGFEDIFVFTRFITEMAKEWGGIATYVRTLLPKGSLRAEGGLGFEMADGATIDTIYPQLYVGSFLVNELKLSCIIGVNPHERLAKQVVVVSLQLAPKGHHRQDDWTVLIDRVTEMVEHSTYETLEALATEIANNSLTFEHVDSVKVSVEKPSALAFVDGAGVEIARHSV